MASRTGGRVVVISDDSDAETAPGYSREVATLEGDTIQGSLQVLSASAAEPVQAGGLDRDDAQQDDSPQQAPEAGPDSKPTPTPKSKLKLRGKGSRMMREIQDYNSDATDSAPETGTPEQADEVAEEFFEGMHLTRAMRKGVDNAVKNRAGAQRKSLNAKELMKKVLRVQPASPKKKKRVKRRQGEANVAAAKREASEVSQTPPNTRTKRGKSRVVESDEDMEGTPGPKPAVFKVTKRRTKQKKKTPSPEVSDDPPYEEDKGDADDTYVSKAPSTFLKPPEMRQTRQSSRLQGIAPALPTPEPKKPSPPKLKTSGMTWSEKKNIIAWLLQQVDYAPGHPRISHHELGDRQLTSWFNRNHEGFNWHTSDTTVAHFSPDKEVFGDFVKFLYTAEHYAGQHDGAVNLTMPHGSVLEPLSSAKSDLTEATTIRAHGVATSLQEKKDPYPGDIFTVDPHKPQDVTARTFLKAIQANRVDVLKNSKLSDAEAEVDVWRQSQVVDVEKEDIIILSAWREFAENVKATPSLRRELGCGNPCLSQLQGNSLMKSTSNKVGVNSASFDLGSTACGMQKSEISTYRLIYHHHGGPRVWTVVRPADFQKLEQLVAGIMELPDSPNPVAEGLASFEIRCHQFVRHNKPVRSSRGKAADTVEDPGSSLYLSEEVLAADGIEFTKFVQYQGELVILFPFAYYQSYNVGPNIVETMAYASKRWETFPTAGLIRQCNRGCHQGEQPHLVDLDFAKPVLATVLGSEVSIKVAVEHTRRRLEY